MGLMPDSGRLTMAPHQPPKDAVGHLVHERKYFVEKIVGHAKFGFVDLLLQELLQLGVAREVLVAHVHEARLIQLPGEPILLNRVFAYCFQKIPT